MFRPCTPLALNSFAGYRTLYLRKSWAGNRNRTDILGLEGRRTNRCAIPAFATNEIFYNNPRNGCNHLYRRGAALALGAASLYSVNFLSRKQDSNLRVAIAIRITKPMESATVPFRHYLSYFFLPFLPFLLWDFTVSVKEWQLGQSSWRFSSLLFL